MTHVLGGDFERRVLARKPPTSCFAINSSGLAHKRSNLPSCQACAFTLKNCFLLNDHRAAVWLEAMQEAVKLCGREPLDDSCPICLQSIAWPVSWRWTRLLFTAESINRNGDEGVVERVSVGPECRASGSVLQECGAGGGRSPTWSARPCSRFPAGRRRPIGSTQEVSGRRGDPGRAGRVSRPGCCR